MARLPAIAVLSCCVACVLTSVHAEVSARTDRYGHYVSTQVLPLGAADDPQVWSVRARSGPRAAALNPDGDGNGDLWPTIAESPRAPFHPWVVWSRFNGSNHDLAWSTWTDRGWSAVEWVQPTATPGRDLDPRLDFDDTGRPYLVWWREDEGRGTVFLSLFLVNRWMGAVEVSPDDTDARYPDVAVTGDGEADVTYTTPEGPRRQRVVLNTPVTITDDIDPQVIVGDDTLPDNAQGKH